MIEPSDWTKILSPKFHGRKRGRPRLVGLYCCGHPKTAENSVGRVQKRCKICKREESERQRKANPEYFKEYRRKNRQYYIDYARRYRGVKVCSIS